MQAVIMAGGKGTRLSSVTKDIPKPMVKLNGKPLLEYQIENLRNCGITEIFMITGHLSHVIMEYFSDGHKWGVNITYYNEEKPLGTAGALAFLRDSLDDDFLLLLGDLYLEVDFTRFILFHKKNNSEISLFAHPNAHPQDSDLIVALKDGRVTDWISKHTERTDYYRNLVNAGIYILNKKTIDGLKKRKKYDLDKEIIAPLIDDGLVYAYRSTEYVKDIGTPERLSSVENDIEKGIPNSRNLSNKQRCIFLDRDGTINRYKGFLRHTEDFELEEKASLAIKKINASPYLTVVVSNQPVIARGECSFGELEKIHSRMETLLGLEGAYLDRIYYCPHHTDKCFEGEVPELKFDCDCRKPKTGMLTRAAAEMNIDLASSWIIGDTTVDIQTGKNAGMKTCLVMTGEAGEDKKYDAKPDLVGKNLLECIEMILGDKE